MWEELENALAWAKAAPAKWIDSAGQDLAAAAQWIWEVIQGDFSDEQTTAQVITGTVISMIPFVDQLCDVRDLVANCRKINEDNTNKWAWVALSLTLIGLFPTLGSLAKGCFKILFAYARKATFKAGAQAFDSDLWTTSKPFVEAGIRKLNDFLVRPEVRRALKALKWDKPYHELSKLARKLAATVNVIALMKAFDELHVVLSKLLDLVQRWGSAAMQTQVGELLAMIKRVREQANARLSEVLAPVQGWLNRLARRLEVEGDNAYRAYTNSVNPHTSSRLALDAEIAELRAATPDWVKGRSAATYKALDDAPSIPKGHFDIGITAPSPLTKAFETFSDIRTDWLPAGTVIFRVVDPGSADNSICWMTKAEFDKLRSKADWRTRFSVWRNWNSNGEFVTYTVPPGSMLPVWRGTTASQPLKDRAGSAVRADKQGNGFWLEGGAEQIVINPKDLNPAYVGKRQPTGWGYGEGNVDVNLVGVPTLTNNWR